MSLLRTFVAVEIGPDVIGKSQKLMNKLKAADAKISWIRPEQMHFTLSFLGDIRDREIPELLNIVTEAVKPLGSFDMLCRGLGVFPSIENPRTIWLGVTYGKEEMEELHSVVENALKKLGVRSEGRRYRPHLTIGRVRSLSNGPDELAKLIEEYKDYEAGLTSVCDVTVFHSEMLPGESQYAVLGHAELRG